LNIVFELSADAEKRGTCQQSRRTLVLTGCEILQKIDRSGLGIRMPFGP